MCIRDRYSKEISEAKVLESWGKMASALCDQWNVFASDLHNEPHASSWGKGTKLDWNKAAERIGNHVLEACPRWMIFVEGVGHTPGAAGQQPNAGYWWGGNLVGVHSAPVKLKDQSRLVYSPHTYGPGVFPNQNYFPTCQGGGCTCQGGGYCGHGSNRSGCRDGCARACAMAPGITHTIKEGTMISTIKSIATMELTTRIRATRAIVLILAIHAAVVTVLFTRNLTSSVSF